LQCEEVPLSQDVWMEHFKLVILLLYYNNFNTTNRLYYVFYHLQLTRHITTLRIAIDGSQTCKSVIVIQILVQFVGNKLVCECHFRSVHVLVI